MNHLPWILKAQGVADETAGGQAPPGSAEPGKDGNPNSGPESNPENRPEQAIITGVVATVNLTKGTCTTTDGMVVHVGSRTAEVAQAIQLGQRVQIDAEGVRTPEGLFAKEVWVRPA